jgi:hypothetical protein
VSSPYSFSDDSELNAIVEQHLAVIRRSIVDAGLKPIALILGGSYGRGEGGIRRDDRGKPRPTNDYDVYMITDGKLPVTDRFKVRRLRKELSKNLGIWHVDVSLVDREDLTRGLVRMAFYDLKFGSHVFYGDSDVTTRIPYQGNGILPGEEVRNLLVNRMVTLVEGHPAICRKLSVGHKARQIAKLFYAIADSRLVTHEAYETLYRRKREGLGMIEGSDAVGRRVLQKMEWCRKAWRYELEDSKRQESVLLDTWKEARELLMNELLEVSTSIDETAYKDDIEAFFKSWRGVPDPVGLRRLRAAVLQSLQGKQNRRLIEKYLFAALSAYPEERYFDCLDLLIPPAPEGKEGLLPSETPWSSFAEELVTGWYNS